MQPENLRRWFDSARTTSTTIAYRRGRPNDCLKSSVKRPPGCQRTSVLATLICRSARQMTLATSSLTNTTMSLKRLFGTPFRSTSPTSPHDYRPPSRPSSFQLPSCRFQSLAAAER